MHMRVRAHVELTAILHRIAALNTAISGASTDVSMLRQRIDLSTEMLNRVKWDRGISLAETRRRVIKYSIVTVRDLLPRPRPSWKTLLSRRRSIRWESGKIFETSSLGTPRRLAAIDAKRNAKKKRSHGGRKEADRAASDIARLDNAAKEKPIGVKQRRRSGVFVNRAPLSPCSAFRWLRTRTKRGYSYQSNYFERF